MSNPHGLPFTSQKVFKPQATKTLKDSNKDPTSSTADRRNELSTSVEATSKLGGSDYSEKWKKPLNAIRFIKQQQRVRFIIDPQMNGDITDCPIEEDDCTVDESLVHYVDSNTKQEIASCTKER